MSRAAAPSLTTRCSSCSPPPLQVPGDAPPLVRVVALERLPLRELELRDPITIPCANSALLIATRQTPSQPALREEVQTLKDLVWFYVIEEAPLATIQHGQRRMIRDLHKWYLDLTEHERDWRHFPPLYREWLRLAQRSQARPGDILRRRIVTDFIAGMTETQVVELYHRMGGYSAPQVFGGQASG